MTKTERVYVLWNVITREYVTKAGLDDVGEQLYQREQKKVAEVLGWGTLIWQDRPPEFVPSVSPAVWWRLPEDGGALHLPSPIIVLDDHPTVVYGCEVYWTTNEAPEAGLAAEGYTIETIDASIVLRHRASKTAAARMTLGRILNSRAKLEIPVVAEYFEGDVRWSVWTPIFPTRGEGLTMDEARLDLARRMSAWIKRRVPERLLGVPKLLPTHDDAALFWQSPEGQRLRRLARSLPLDMGQQQEEK